jgi:Ni,Fe-hydrogenase I cytochrome b subunit
MSNDQLLREHQVIWKGFVRFITLSTAFVVVVLGLMAIFLL